MPLRIVHPGDDRFLPVATERSIAFGGRPQNLVSFNTPGTATRLELVNGRTYIADGYGGIQVIDATNPAAPRRLTAFNTYGPAIDIEVHDDFVLVAEDYDGFEIVEVTPTGALRSAGRHPTDGRTADLAVARGYAYLADSVEGGVQVLDTRDPTRPTVVARYPTFGQAEALEIAGDLALVGSSALEVVDPTRPRLVSEWAANNRIAGLSFVDVPPLLAVANRDLDFLDLRNPAGPTRIGGARGNWSAEGVTVGSGIAAVAGSYAGLRNGRP